MIEHTTRSVSGSRASALVALALRGLEPMYDFESRLFCHRLRKTSEGLVREGLSHRYTIMTLLGLLEAQSAGWSHSTDIDATAHQLLHDTDWVDNLGDLGLLLWLCGSMSKERLQEFYSQFDVSRALSRYPDACLRLTMELSWFLTGLVHAYRTEPCSRLASVAAETSRRLQENQGPHGLFGHMAVAHSFRGVFRGRIGSFADQVYPMVALSHFARLFNDHPARESALGCARAICGRQGSMGQWWWHYNSVSGRVVEHYPVYSVHQHGMAPMALNAVQELSDADFQTPLSRGLKWIDGTNEMGESLESPENGIIWRCVRLAKRNPYLVGCHTLMGRTPSAALHTLHECRPYELGWLLYALAAPGPSRYEPFRFTGNESIRHRSN